MTDYSKQIDEILRAFRQHEHHGVMSDTPEMLTLDEAKAKLQHLLQQVEVAARADEVQAITDYTPVSLNFDYRKYAQDRLQSLQKTQEGSDD